MMATGWQTEPLGALSPKAQTATWCHRHLCLKKTKVTKATSSFNVTIMEIKGMKTPGRSLGHQWLVFPGVPFSQKSGRISKTKWAS